MTRFLITGASGLLGLNMALQLTDEGHVVFGVVHQNPLQNVPFTAVHADLAQNTEVNRLLEMSSPDVVIHCAALANIDICETQPELAIRLNAELPGYFAAAASRTGVQFVHISTDAVFDGQRGNYFEIDAAHPINAYAQTKLTGERKVSEANPDAIIARVNFYGWSLRGQRSLAEWFHRNLSDGNVIKGFTDVFFCPLFVGDLVDILQRMVQKKLNGIYHVLSPESLSKYDFGRRIALQFGFDDKLITPISVEEGGLKAVRSPNLTLRTDKLVHDLGMPLPDQTSGLQRFYQQAQQDYPAQLAAYILD
jgi:dTDP-4-dehydrorhamnose reductase